MFCLRVANLLFRKDRSTKAMLPIKTHVGSGNPTKAWRVTASTGGKPVMDRGRTCGGSIVWDTSPRRTCVGSSSKPQRGLENAQLNCFSYSRKWQSAYRPYKDQLQANMGAKSSSPQGASRPFSQASHSTTRKPGIITAYADKKRPGLGLSEKKPTILLQIG